MRSAIFLLILTSCVSSSIDLGNEPSDAGSREDAAFRDATEEDVGEDVQVELECDHATDCVLTSGCCPECGPVRGDIVSRPRDMRADAVPTTCDDVLCEECVGEPSDPTLIPACVDHYCTFIDLLDAGDLNHCEPSLSGQECTVRASTCCECGFNDEDLIALRTDKLGVFHDVVCDGTERCDECPPDYSRFVSECEVDALGNGRCTFYDPEDG